MIPRSGRTQRLFAASRRDSPIAGVAVPDMHGNYGINGISASRPDQAHDRFHATHTVVSQNYVIVD
jgi:hypothetical protein